LSQRIVNLTNGHRLKYSQALRLIDQCVIRWKVVGVSVENLSLADTVKARSEQARLREPMEYAEIHGLRFDPPASGVEATRRERPLIFAAHEFLRRVAA
jgi:hypothetical protein